MKKNELSDRYFTTLSCKVFIMGHSTEGESAIVALYDDCKIVYSCVVDSFISNDRIIAKEMLHGLGITKISDLFWTHPHDDHSDGIIELIDEFKPDDIYLAAELHSLPDTVRTVSSEVLTKINTYRGYDKRCKNQPKVHGIATNYTIHDEVLMVGSKLVPFEMFTIAPVDGRIRKRIVDGKTNALNDYSLVFTVNIGDFSILLTGDVQDKMIVAANDDLCRNIITPNLLKIPHHGSVDSIKILDIFDEDGIVDFGVTTAKKSSDLPRREALDAYHSRCQHMFRIDPKSSEFAVWGIDVDIIAGTITPLVYQSFAEFE